MKLLSPTPAGIAEAALALRNGEVVSYPTETMYGLGVDPFSPLALARLFKLKQRPARQPVLLIVGEEAQLSRVIRAVPRQARLLMDAFWPGPLSLLFPRSPTLPEAVTARGDLVCVRCPDNATARRLCRAFDGAITSTSANLSGTEPARTAKDAALDGVALVLDGGDLTPGPASTVYDPVSGLLIREGPIRLKQIEAVLKAGAGGQG